MKSQICNFVISFYKCRESLLFWYPELGGGDTECNSAPLSLPPQSSRCCRSWWPCCPTSGRCPPRSPLRGGPLRGGPPTWPWSSCATCWSTSPRTRPRASRPSSTTAPCPRSSTSAPRTTGEEEDDEGVGGSVRGGGWEQEEGEEELCVLWGTNCKSTLSGHRPVWTQAVKSNERN